MRKMKRVLAGTLATVVMAASVLPVGYGGFNKSVEKTYASTGENMVDVDGEWSGDWIYSILEDGTIEINEYRGEESELVVPEQIDGRNVTSIGGWAFYDQRFDSVKLPEGLISIGERAFCASSIGSLEVPDSLISIGDYAFSEAGIGGGIELPEGLKYIGDFAFSYFYGFNNNGGFTKLPESLISIGGYSFYYSNLVIAEISASVTSIGYGAFCGSGVGTFKVDPENKVYDSRNDCNGIIETSSNTLIAGCGTTKIPFGVTKIGVLAFSYCYNLSDIEIPESVTNIESIAFKGCSLLDDVVIPDSVTYIADDAFNNWIVIISSRDSYAHSYAIRNGIAWKEKESSPVPPVVSNFTYSARSSSAVALKWAKNDSADGYVIEQYKNGKWTVIKTITSNATTSYKVTGLSASTANKFRIKAYKTVDNTKYYSDYTVKTVNTLPAGVKNFTYSVRSSSAVALKWTKNTSASGYVIEQYKNGKWVAIKTIKSNATTSYKVTGLKASTANKFRIKAYKNYGSAKLYSGYVSKSINTLPSGVAGFTYSARTKNTITLKWNKNTSATGYVIEQYKNGKWVKIKTVTKNSTVSYKVSGLKKATSYKFRIKAYKSYGKTNLYSGYVTKTIKTK